MHPKKRWLMDSIELQKLQYLLPFQFLLTRLSFVKITPFFKYHMKILIFNGSLNCQISCVTLILVLTRRLYMDLTENTPFLWRDHTNIFLPSWRFTCTILVTRSCHSKSLAPTKDLLKDILSGDVLKTSATVACFFRTMLYKFGYWDFNVRFPNHVSFHNLVCGDSSCYREGGICLWARWRNVLQKRSSYFVDDFFETNQIGELLIILNSINDFDHCFYFWIMESSFYKLKW